MSAWSSLNSGSCDAAFNMAMDEALLENISAIGRPVLRFYGWRQAAATFGYFQNYAAVARATPLRPLIRRPTGGGLVPHDADWTYSLTVPPEHEWFSLAAVESYRRIHEQIQAAFAKIKIETELALCCCKPEVQTPKPKVPAACFTGHERFDLLWRGRKIAGAAQRRNKLGLLIQGSVQPPENLPRADWESALADDAPIFSPPDGLIRRAAALARDKYSSPGHNEQR